VASARAVNLEKNPDKGGGNKEKKKSSLFWNLRLPQRQAASAALLLASGADLLSSAMMDLDPRLYENVVRTLIPPATCVALLLVLVWLANPSRRRWGTK
jgi:hypothetical protein